MTDSTQIERYAVSTEMGNYLTRPGAQPRAPITVNLSLADAIPVVRDYVAANWRNVACEPRGALKYGYVVPGGWYGHLWDWDSFFISCALPEEGLSYAQGSLRSLVENIQADGRPPKQASVEGEMLYMCHPKPLQAQFAYIVSRRMKDFRWVDALWGNLEKLTAWYERETVKEGYFTWLTYEGYGIDNNPAVYGRPEFTSAGVDLAVWHYREYRALARLATELNRPGADGFTEKAEALKSRIVKDYWDQIDHFFYNLDLCFMNPTWRQKRNWHYYLKFRNWASFFPLWGGVATPEQARWVVKAIMDEREFLSPAGVRTHSAIDPIYNNEQLGGPSNWQGPVWGLSSCVTAYAMARYGYGEEAREVAGRFVRTVASDIRQNGCMHEYYHGDTGQPVMKPNFFCWNLLAGRVMDDLAAGVDCTSLDLLDAQG